MLVGVNPGWASVLAQAPTPVPAPKGGPYPVAEPWPPFVMVYRETLQGREAGAATGTQLVRVDYTDRRHYRTTILENPNVPESVGTTTAIDGLQVTHRDAKLNINRATARDPNEPLNAPADWLIPGKMAGLERLAPWAKSAVSEELGSLRQEYREPSGRQMGEEYTYRLADGIPMRYVATVNGVETVRKEAVEFRIGASYW